MVSVVDTPADERQFEQRGLVIDDNEDAATAMLIQDMRGEACVAYDGESALAMVQEYQSEVVLLDIGMRGQDGYEICRRMRDVLGGRVLLVALTGFGQDEDKEQATRRVRRPPHQACQSDGLSEDLVRAADRTGGPHCSSEIFPEG